ncbi:MAG: PCMD domain-containing protein [Bacteroidales bacterium]|nr:PCMD domain-containing protein [Bacteroidales bacterium]
MKKSLLLGLIINIFIISPFFAQQAPNSGFESWDNINKATDWTCSISAYGFTLNTVTRSSQSNSGNYSAKLETKAFITGDIIPGMIQLGNINIEEEEPYGGIPFTQKPTALEVNLKYDQQGGDSLVVICYLTKQEKGDPLADVLGGAFFTYANPIDEFTTFIIPIYYQQEGTPDTLNIFFASSYLNPHQGSMLWVDDITIHFDNFFLPPLPNLPENAKDTSFTASWIGADYTKSYILDIATDENFGNHLSGFTNLNVGDTTAYHVAIPDTSIKTIYYRLKADYDSILTDYSDAITFNVPYAPKCFEGKNITHESFKISWQNLPLSNYYILDIATDSLFQDFFSDYYYFTLDSNYYTVTDLEPETDYYCRVRARYLVAGKSNYSNIIKITTAPVPDEYSLKILSLSDKIAFLTDSSFINSEIVIYNARGQMYWDGIIKDFYTEIYTPFTELFIIQIIKPDGELIRKKLGFIANK